MAEAGPDGGGFERRTVLRAGVWTAPAIVVSTAAPAFACSPSTGLTLGSFVAAYVNATNAGSVDPTRITVTSSVTNSGTSPTVGYTRILTIPSNLFDTVVTSTPAGYGTPTVTGTLSDGWTLVYVRANQLAGGASDAFAATLTVGGTTTSPFRGWQGPAFTLAGQASGGSACGTVPTSAGVQATSDTTLTIVDWRANRTSTTNDLWVGDDNSSGTANTLVRNTGRKAVGPITLAVTVPDAGGRYSSVSGSAPTNVTAGWGFVSRTPSSNTAGPWTYTFRTTGDALAPDGLNGSLLNDHTPPFRARILLAGSSSGTPATVMVSAVASAPGATSSAVASLDAE